MHQIRVLFFIVFSCCQAITLYANSNNSAEFEPANNIKDHFGRTLILHGLNTASNAKHSTDNHPWIQEKEVIREDTEFCFNTVRYLIFWGAIEPQQGVYNQNYLDEVKKRVEWYTQRKMFVIIDMHQDIYGFGVGGNGAPDWASTQTKIQNLISDKQPWWMQNLEPKVKRSYVQFWKYKKKQFLQQHYIAAWLKVAEMFKDNPYVIGYDLMNEPHGGNIVKTLFGKFEKKWLMNFYNRLIPAIREVEKDKYLLFEPRSFGVNFGMKSYLKKVEDAIPNAKLIYAPHCYPRFVDIGKSYNRKSKKDVVVWLKRRESEAKMHNTPILLGEFGVSPSKKDYDLFLSDLLRKADSVQMSWTYWSNDLGGWSPLKGDLTPSPILWKLLRVYPKATAGKLHSFQYEPSTKIFSMYFSSDTAIIAPTEIAVPKLIYPNGFKISVAGTTKYRIETDSVRNTLLLFVDENNREIEVTIQPK